MNTWEVPGKIFITGEYAVLIGAPALVAALKPNYLSMNGKIISPGLGAGFGSSIAEWISLQPNLDRPRLLWQKYQADSVLRTKADKMNEADIIPPSGADLLAQVIGGIVCVQSGDANQMKTSPHWLKHFYLLKPKQMFKEKTFLNLRQPKVLNWFKSPSMQSMREKWLIAATNGLNAWKSENLNSFCESVQEYSELAAKCELSSSESVLNCDLIYNIPGVLAVKGCGAGFHDVYLVVSPSKIPTHENYEILGNLHDMVSYSGARVCRQ